MLDPTAKDLLLLKVSVTMTTAGIYIKPNPVPARRLIPPKIPTMLDPKLASKNPKAAITAPAMQTLMAPAFLTKYPAIGARNADIATCKLPAIEIVPRDCFISSTRGSMKTPKEYMVPSKTLIHKNEAKPTNLRPLQASLHLYSHHFLFAESFLHWMTCHPFSRIHTLVSVSHIPATASFLLQFSFSFTIDSTSVFTLL